MHVFINMDSLIFCQICYCYVTEKGVNQTLLKIFENIFFYLAHFKALLVWVDKIEYSLLLENTIVLQYGTTVLTLALILLIKLLRVDGSQPIQ